MLIKFYKGTLASSFFIMKNNLKIGKNIKYKKSSIFYLKIKIKNITNIIFFINNFLNILKYLNLF